MFACNSWHCKIIKSLVPDLQVCRSSKSSCSALISIVYWKSCMASFDDAPFFQTFFGHAFYRLPTVLWCFRICTFDFEYVAPAVRSTTFFQLGAFQCFSHLLLIRHINLAWFLVFEMCTSLFRMSINLQVERDISKALKDCKDCFTLCSWIGPACMSQQNMGLP